MDDTMWDVFICHAWEDKEEIARPLAEALQQEGLRVWYDEFELKVGDSLRRSVAHGLRNSRYGVVILSPSFFAKELPKKELDGLAAREVNSGKVILPIWHKVTHDDVLNFSPELADKIAILTDKGVQDVVQQLLKVFPKEEKRKTEKSSVVHLRSEPLTVSGKEFKKVFGLDEKRRPLEYLQNDYEDQGEVVFDRATDLTWQKADSGERLTYPQTEVYVKTLNSQKFANHDDWRLPTIPELMSLLEPEKQENGLYMNPIFSVSVIEESYRCWSADRLLKGEGGSSGTAWSVRFLNGFVGWDRLLLNTLYVRVVRSRE